MEDFFTSRFGAYSMMLTLCLGLVLFLRFLFGPKGLFRDPKWDESNARIRQEEETAKKARLEIWEKQ